MSDHADIVASYHDSLLKAIIKAEGRRNLRDYRDHETRWMAGRISACRAELQKRRTLAAGKK